MEKMRLESKDITDENIKKILELFPNVATEAKDENGKLRTAIDFDKLKQELSKDVVDGEECYDFTWVGKNEAMVEANRPIRKTLRPCRDKSLNWEDTENIYIEGDNLEALKLLQESYLGKIKMIYIDPPYNTGNDFVYKDNFTQDKDSYNEELGIKDEDENRLFQNTESNGRFHSDWCSMIYSRLKLARNLLSDDGLICISIDDNEVDNIKKICDEIFGNENFVATCPRKTRGAATTKSDAELQKLNDYIVLYWKSKYIAKFNLKLTGEKIYPLNDERGKFYIVPLQDNGPHGTKTARPNLYYPIYSNALGKVSRFKNDNFNIELLPSKHKNDDGCWMWSIKKFDNDKDDLYVKNNKLYIKHYYNPNEDQNKYQREKTWLDEFMNTKGTLCFNSYFNIKGIFDHPKPLELINYFLTLVTDTNSIILDFFSGSATTAHACMQLNAEDGGNRKFIMVQLPEKTDEKSEAFKAGYKNICEIGEERIRRAGKKILEENPDKKIDVGFRVFKVDDTNMKDVYYSPNETNQKQLGLYESNIKDDRTDEDLLYGCLLDWGVELSLPHRVETIDGKRVHIVDEDALIACFEENIPESVIRKIAGMKPLRVVFRDSSFNSDDNKINVEEIFKLITPDTRVKVI